MKKKSILTIVVSLALVLVLGVGATLAVITAKDAPVTNTFKFGSIKVGVSEKKPEATAGEKITGTSETGWSYENVVPGQTLNKAPVVSVTTSVDTYVFIEIKGLSANVTAVGSIADGWTPYDTDKIDAYGNGVYYKTVAGTGTAATTTFDPLFTQVTVNGNLAGTEQLDSISIGVYAIQQTGVALADAYAQADFQIAD